jgi:hypothetical protein
MAICWRPATFCHLLDPLHAASAGTFSGGQSEPRWEPEGGRSGSTAPAARARTHQAGGLCAPAGQQEGHEAGNSTGTDRHKQGRSDCGAPSPASDIGRVSNCPLHDVIVWSSGVLMLRGGPPLSPESRWKHGSGRPAPRLWACTCEGWGRNGPGAPGAIFASSDSACGSAATVIVTGPAAPVTVPRVRSRPAGDWSVCPSLSASHRVSERKPPRQAGLDCRGPYTGRLTNPRPSR